MAVSRRDWIRSLHGTALGIGVLAILVVVDLPTDWVLANSYVVAPLLTAILSRPSRTALVGVVMVAASAGSLDWDHTSASTVHSEVIRMVVAGSIAVVAVVAASVRVQRENQLSHMTQIAEAAQLALLPAIPARAADLQLASRYVSATSEALIGGDLYELAETKWGVRLVVGDARGKGLDAIQRMVHVLGAFRQLVHQSKDLAEVARQVDGVVSQVVNDEDFVTALFVQFSDDTITVVNCGHHPPLLIDAEGARLLEDALPTLPLGLGSDPTSASYTWESGRMLLYTDGLVEAREKNGREFFPLLANADVLVGGALPVALDRLIARLHRHVGGRINDDIALVLVQR